MRPYMEARVTCDEVVEYLLVVAERCRKAASDRRVRWHGRRREFVERQATDAIADAVCARDMAAIGVTVDLVERWGPELE